MIPEPSNGHMSNDVMQRIIRDITSRPSEWSPLALPSDVKYNRTLAYASLDNPSSVIYVDLADCMITFYHKWATVSTLPPSDAVVDFVHRLDCEHARFSKRVMRINTTVHGRVYPTVLSFNL